MDHKHFKEAFSTITDEAALRAHRIEALGGRPVAVDTTKIPLWQEKPEPIYEMSTRADGQPVSTAKSQSPFSARLMSVMHRDTNVMDLIARGRPADLIKHAQYIQQQGPIIEARHNVSAREIFLKGDGKQATRLMNASKEDYDLLKSYSRYL